MKHRFELPLYSFYDHTGMVHRLEKMARRGWILDKMGGMLWRYRQEEPCRLKYAVVYFPEVTGFEPTPPERHLRLQELCAQAGWILAATAGKFQVYCNEDPDAVPLETDPGIQVDIIHRTMKRNFIPSYLLLSLAAVLQLFMQNPRQVFSRDQLLSQIWGSDYVGETRTVDVHIGTLRTKLGTCGDYIQTVRGVGYRMEEKV